MCGLLGIVSNCKEMDKDMASYINFGLFALQHRGQQGAGIALHNKSKFVAYKDKGLTPEVFTAEILSELGTGNIGLGHVSYCKGIDKSNLQPFVFQGSAGQVAIILEGKILNWKKLKEDLVRQGAIFSTNLDAEVLAVLINASASKNRQGLTNGIKEAAQVLRGSYSAILVANNVLYAWRDAYGIKPLCLGKFKNGSYVVASESCAIDAYEADFLRDIKNGEIVRIEGEKVDSVLLNEDWREFKRKTCIFEHVYFARPDSTIDGVSVSGSRFKAGEILARNYGVEADIVAGVPDSAIVAARGYSSASGIPYSDVLSKNRYIHRTFIQPTQAERRNSVFIKHNVIKANVKGKRIVLIDDSIVRGTTSKRIVQMLRNAGAKEVHFRIASPIVMHPCYYGVDTQDYANLIGANKSKEEIHDMIGADSLEFLTLKQVLQSVSDANQFAEIQNAKNTQEIFEKSSLCTACFDGLYPISVAKHKLKVKEFNLEI